LYADLFYHILYSLPLPVSQVDFDEKDVGEYASRIQAAINASRPAPLLSVCELGPSFDLIGSMKSNSVDKADKTKGSTKTKNKTKGNTEPKIEGSTF